MLSYGPQFADFCEQFLVHTKGPMIGQPLVLDDEQREFWNEFHSVDKNGLRIYRQGLKGVPRGNGKTPECAADGLFELMTRVDAPEVFNFAGAEDQGAELTEFARGFVEGRGGAGGQLKRWLVAHKKAITHKHTFGSLRLLAASGLLQHSKSVSAAIGDELHAFEQESQIETAVAMLSALHKRPNAYFLGITTAGFSKQSWLGQMYEHALATMDIEERRIVPGIGPCLRIGRDRKNGILFWWYGPPDDLDPLELIENDEVIRACNPASWLTTEAIKSQRHLMGLDEYDFARLHLNMWTSTKEVFIPMGPWRKGADKSIAPQRKTVPTYVAVDVGLTHDTTSVSWSQPLPDGRVVTRWRVWSARPEHEHDKTARHVFVPGGRMRLELVETFILALAKTLALREIVYDPTFFEGEAQRLARATGVKTAPIYQAGVLPEVAYQVFYQDASSSNAVHADDPVVNRHMAAATGIKTERGWRVSELQSAEPIDALQSGSMSHWRAKRSINNEITGALRYLGPPLDDEDD